MARASGKIMAGSLRIWMGKITGMLRENGVNELRVMQEWLSEDRRRERSDRWVNVLVGKMG